jgi:hypothetical protein
MNFAELYAEVVSITKRPDLEGRTRSALRQAVMFSHRSNNFWRDLVDNVEVPIPAPEGILLLEDHFPRMRSIASFEAVRADGTSVQLDETAVDSLRDEYGERKKFWYYGTAVGIRYSAYGSDRVRLAYYNDPVVTEAGFDSWIAKKYPDAIIRWATSLIFKSIGNNDEAGQELQIAQALLQQLTTGDFNIKGI